MFYAIRLELARTPEFPDGNSEHRFELLAPLTEQGLLDLNAWELLRDSCTVRRIVPDAPGEEGQLVRRGPKGWAFSYAPGRDDDEPLFRLGHHPLCVGEYVTITEHGGRALPFRVTAVEPRPTRSEAHRRPALDEEAARPRCITSRALRR